jgi:hypothetical protein
MGRRGEKKRRGEKREEGDVGQGLNMDACFEGLGFRGRWSRLEHGRLL